MQAVCRHCEGTRMNAIAPRKGVEKPDAEQLLTTLENLIRANWRAMHQFRRLGMKGAARDMAHDLRLLLALRMYARPDWAWRQ